ncbi:MurR/RpiR family transcriptional regulator [Clostridium sp. Marseille-P2415]|uniref:MurR/RpiR family transcriptional regulator n=1 Tax=Clostridium sp. Marseille-P2415 TaxID=1805471 RepID=UPI00190EF240|nr:MurR/RpiR family transcriptional regulator [Clostridium sp. Marseille-P2415]
MDLSKLTVGKNLTEVEDSVLRYIIEHMDSMLKMGVRGVAKENFTSTSTIMRLTKKLGYNGFVDMYYKLLPLVNRVLDNISADLQFMNSFCSNSLLKHNSYDDIREFASRISRLGSGYVFLYATGFSAIPVEYLTKKLLVLGIKCIYSNGMDSIGVFENNLENMEMLIVVSRSGETDWVADRVKTARENGVFTVSFTNEVENRVSAMTDMQFRIEDSNKLDDRNMMANTFFPNVLMLMELLVYEYHKVLQNMDKKEE